VTDEEDGTPLLRYVPHLSQALPLKSRVAHRENLVHQQDLRLQMRRHGEGKPQVHARGVTLDRGIQESLNFGKRHNLVELADDLPPAHAENGSR